MKVLITGDTHGNAQWLRDYLFPRASALDCDKLVVLGDFGYWEHTSDGVAFLNEVDAIAYSTGIPLYWLPGNHDKTSMALNLYGQRTDAQGFLVCREHVLMIPNGHCWSWDGNTLRAFGGAYSVDKFHRLRLEQARYENLVDRERHRATATRRPVRPVPSQAGTLWFPEEEMTDEEMYSLLGEDSTRKDVVLSHDKPMAADPQWQRKNIAECLANQQRLQRALDRHRPRYWLHGHLHHFYRDQVEDTLVVGFEPDGAAAEDGWKAANSWAVLDLPEWGSGKTLSLSLGSDVEVEPAKLQQALDLIY